MPKDDADVMQTSLRKPPIDDNTQNNLMSCFSSVADL